MREHEQFILPDGCLPSLIHSLELTASIALLLHLSRYAFSGKVRDIIKARAHGRSEVPGDTQRDLICGHLDHDPDSPLYNDPCNGVYWSRRQEYIYHYESEGENGLTIHDNRTTLKGIWNMLTASEKRGLPKPPKV